MYKPLSSRIQQKFFTNSEIKIIQNETKNVGAGRGHYNVRFISSEGDRNSYDIMAFISRFTPDDVVIEPLCFTKNALRLSNSFKELYAELGLKAIENWANIYSRKKIYIIYDDIIILQISMDKGYRTMLARPVNVGKFRGAKRLY